ncbi:MAG TPA: DUF4810 domain-containing protein [Candidatus Deferrimicrobiaceae bacterium]|nr:DUF4810 domain-containing protein [Candidatus Deferrimicrobiaceae bacterium]
MAKRGLLLLAVSTMLLALTQGCAPSRKYAWGNYDSTMFVHYKKPQEKEAYLERLKQIVENAEAEDRAPPGLYAEYGYALFENGNPKEAIGYFEKERAKWPESNVLMEKMIRNVRRQQETLGTSSPAGPAAGQEGTR